MGVRLVHLGRLWKGLHVEGVALPGARESDGWAEGSPAAGGLGSASVCVRLPTQRAEMPITVLRR